MVMRKRLQIHKIKWFRAMQSQRAKANSFKCLLWSRIWIGLFLLQWEKREEGGEFYPGLL